MKTPKVIQSLWTAPYPPDTKDYLLDLEVICMCLNSAYTLKCTNARPVLYTDFDGYDYFSRKNMLGLFSEVIPIPFNETLRIINPQINWSFGKLISMNDAIEKHESVIHVDFDAFIKEPFWTSLSFPVVALNSEPLDWECYKDRSQEFGYMGHRALSSAFRQFEIEMPTEDWNPKWYSAWMHTNPVNTGVVMFNDPRFWSFYFFTVSKFLDEYSSSNKPGILMDDPFTSGQKYFVEVVTYEQRLLALAYLYWFENSQIRPKTVQVISSLDASKKYLLYNRQVAHLWNTKLSYIRVPLYRHLFVQYACRELHRLDNLDWISVFRNFGIANSRCKDSVTGAEFFSEDFSNPNFIGVEHLKKESKI